MPNPLAFSSAGPSTLEPVLAHRLAVNASWLLRLRWVAVVGQVTTIVVASTALGVSLPLLPLIGIVTVTAVTNIVLMGITRRLRGEEYASERSPLILVGVMLLDMVLLTGLLYFTGGTDNPFSLFFLVHVALAAMLAPSRWCWALTAAAIVCFCWLHAVEVPHLTATDSATLDNWTGLALRPEGFLVALVTCALVITYFVTRVTSELQDREAQLRHAQLQQLRTERLEALATLAAGAAHELATPLSTIAVVATELDRHLRSAEAPQAVRDDIQLVRSELARCRTILNRMAGDAGQVAGDELRRLPVATIIAEALQGIPSQHKIIVRKRGSDGGKVVIAPLQGLAQALRGILQNACDASRPGQPIVLETECHMDHIEITVTDTGVGMAPGVLAKVGEPFYTTKEPGVGTGLGVFLTRSVIERLGGTIRFESQPAQGTRVFIRLPTAAGVP